MNSNISHNIANVDSGGIAVISSEAILYNTTVSFNKADSRGGGIYMRGYPDSATKANLTKCVIQGNELTTGPGGDGICGGGLRLQHSVNLTIRETSFKSNIAGSIQGHEICTIGKTPEGAPTISLINTFFDNPKNSNNFYHYDEPGGDRKAVWNSCASTSASPLCTEPPFTGLCDQINNSNTRVRCHLFGKGHYMYGSKYPLLFIFTNFRRSSRPMRTIKRMGLPYDYQCRIV